MVARLIYIMGPSGAGKDTLLKALAERRPDLNIVRRYITRHPDASENSLELSPKTFEKMKAIGQFCLSWEAHGCCYGVGKEVESALDSGQTVVINGSRRVLAEAKDIFGDALVPVLITANIDILRRRLESRGRENARQIEQRLYGAMQYSESLADAAAIIDNSGQLAAGVLALQRFIDMQSGNSQAGLGE